VDTSISYKLSDDLGWWSEHDLIPAPVSVYHEERAAKLAEINKLLETKMKYLTQIQQAEKQIQQAEKQMNEHDPEPFDNPCCFITMCQYCIKKLDKKLEGLK
jgi:hypothetical protein